MEYYTDSELFYVIYFKYFLHILLHVYKIKQKRGRQICNTIQNVDYIQIKYPHCIEIIRLIGLSQFHSSIQSEIASGIVQIFQINCIKFLILAEQILKMKPIINQLTTWAFMSYTLAIYSIFLRDFQIYSEINQFRDFMMEFLQNIYIKNSESMSYFFFYPQQNCFQYIGETMKNENEGQNQPKEYNYSGSTVFFNSLYSIPTGFQNYYPYPVGQNVNQVVSPAPTTLSIPNNQGEDLHRKQEKTKGRKRKNVQTEIESAKKNGQSNLINHFFSFFSSQEKSDYIVEGAISTMNKNFTQRQALFHLFYNTIHILNGKRGRKYVNREILFSLILEENMGKVLPEIKQKVQKIQNIDIKDLCKLFQKCVFNFYRYKSIDLVLTSKRISVVAKQQHLKRRRKIYNKIFFQTQKN